MADDVSTVVDAAAEALESHDARDFVESLRHLSTQDPVELFAELFRLIDELAGDQADTDLPTEDVFGESGVPEVVRAVRDHDLHGLLALAGEGTEMAVAKLLAVAAALR